MAYSEDSFILEVLAIGSSLATLRVESEYKEQTATENGAYESHFLYTVGNPPAISNFGAEWTSSGTDTRTPVSHFEPAAPVQNNDWNSKIQFHSYKKNCKAQQYFLESGSVGKPNLPDLGPRRLLFLKLTLMVKYSRRSMKSHAASVYMKILTDVKNISKKTEN